MKVLAKNVFSAMIEKKPTVTVGFVGHVTRCATKNLLGTFFMLCLLYIFFHLLTTKPKFSAKTCPPLYGASQRDGEKTTRRRTDVSRAHADPYVVNCAAVFAGDEREIKIARDHRECQPKAITETDYSAYSTNCSKFRADFGYDSYTIEAEEKEFPVAFSILTFEHFHQTERLLRAIFRPQNYYCIHVDFKSAKIFQRTFERYVKCFDNIFLATHPVDVVWSEFPVLEAEIHCMMDLLKKSKKWKYFINLTGREYPIRTNWELVQILKAYNGANDIDGTLHRRPIIWTKYVWRNQNWMTWKEKEPPPAGFNIAKGSTHIAATRAFIEYVVRNATARELLNWMRDIRAPDEHYFPTLNHNPHKGIPGAYKGDPDLKRFLTRFKIWQSTEEFCDGTWWRFICNFGVGDLQRIGQAKELFANKFHMEFDPIAFDCMEQWYMNRTKADRSSLNFDVDYYGNQVWVKNHVIVEKVDDKTTFGALSEWIKQ